MVRLTSNFQLIDPNNIVDRKIVFLENFIIYQISLPNPRLVEQKVRKAYYTHYTIDDKNFLGNSL